MFDSSLNYILFDNIDTIHVNHKKILVFVSFILNYFLSIQEKWKLEFETELKTKFDFKIAFILIFDSILKLTLS